MILDTAEYVPILQELTEEGKEVCLKISGNSMLPFLRNGRDFAFFARPDTPLEPGQIVFYRRSGGQYVLHRICRIENGMLYLAGDAQAALEGPVSQDAVFARVTRVRRGEKLLTPDTPAWKFFAQVWRRCRLIRPPLTWIYSRLFSR